MNSKITAEKAFNVLLHVSSKLQEERNLYKVLKAIYYADKLHLEQYGRQLFPQKYLKLDYGNVPMDSYDVCTHVRDNKDQPRMPERVKARIRVKKDTITPIDRANLDYLSKSEQDCLQAAIEKLRPMTFAQVLRFLHRDDPAYNNAVKVNNRLDLERDIIPTLENGVEILEYIRNPHPAD